MNQVCSFIISHLEAAFGHFIFHNLLSSCYCGYQILLPILSSLLLSSVVLSFTPPSNLKINKQIKKSWIHLKNVLCYFISTIPRIMKVPRSMMVNTCLCSNFLQLCIFAQLDYSLYNMLWSYCILFFPLLVLKDGVFEAYMIYPLLVVFNSIIIDLWFI